MGTPARQVKNGGWGSRRKVRITSAMVRVHALRILLAATPLAVGNPLDPSDLMTAMLCSAMVGKG